MTTDPVELIGLALVGAAAGVLAARASVALPVTPDRPPAPGLRRYAFCALACAAAALWSALTPQPAPALVGALLGVQLVLIALLDAEHFWLPHRLTVPLGLSGLAEAAAFQPELMLHRLIGAAVGFALLWSIAALYRRARGREGMGGGDFRLLAAAGCWVGWAGLPTVLVLACLSGLVVVALQALRARRLNLQMEVPFGVFLAAGLWLTWLYGPAGRSLG